MNLAEQTRVSVNETKQIRPGLEQLQLAHKARCKTSVNSEFQNQPILPQTIRGHTWVKTFVQQASGEFFCVANFKFGQIYPAKLYQ